MSEVAGVVEGVFDVSADGEGGVLTSEELVFYAFELKPWISRCALVFIAFYKVPSLELSVSERCAVEYGAYADEMFGHVHHRRTAEANRNIVPWHSSVFGLVELVLFPGKG